MLVPESIVRKITLVDSGRFYFIFDEIIAHSEVVVAVVVGFSDEGEIL